MIGLKFGQLVVLDPAPDRVRSNKTMQQVWYCRCQCGVTSIYYGSNLRRGKSTKCRECAYKLRPQSIRRKTYFERLFDLRILRSAKKRGIPVTLTLDEFRYLATSSCVYCKTKPVEISYIGNTKYTWNESHKVLGVDRVDSSVGYVFGNCVTCCKICNIMKSTLSVDEFKAHIERIYKTIC